MTHEETKTEQNQTLSRVPLETWRKFKIECAKEGVTMTQGFIDAFNIWKERNIDKQSN